MFDKFRVGYNLEFCKLDILGIYNVNVKMCFYDGSLNIYSLLRISYNGGRIVV